MTVAPAQTSRLGTAPPSGNPGPALDGLVAMLARAIERQDGNGPPRTERPAG